MLLEFVGSWSGNLSTIYALDKGRLGVGSLQTPFIG